MQDHEDPDSYCSKQVGNIPVLVLDQEAVYVIVGKNILFQTELGNMAAAVVAFIGAFYLFDFDYPKQHEYGMLMFQTLVFEDKTVPGDIAQTFEGMAKMYRRYKSESS